MAESGQDAQKSGDEKAKAPKPFPDDHVTFMAEYIFKRAGRRATLTEAEQALNNLSRVMEWLYKHRNDLNKKKL